MKVTDLSTRPTEVRGNTLRVYMYLIKKGPSELRDVQRGLELSTPSLASYHLEKLASGGYVAQNERGEYYASRDSLGEVVEGFSRLGVLIVPQLLFFAVLFTPLVLYFGYLALGSDRFIPELVAVSLGLAGVTWYETIRVWRKFSAA